MTRGNRLIQSCSVTYANLTHAEGWIIPSLISSIQGYADGWKSIQISLANQKKDQALTVKLSC